jgi:hypothetical protein
MVRFYQCKQIGLWRNNRLRDTNELRSAALPENEITRGPVTIPAKEIIR